ncbi:hypothetical protein [Joostella sp. CR20]|uniref:hypothetical protein n=1 Tax=Joostella sp. CR20 TaxID=2804312 RepID=UPI00313DC236
MNRFLKLFLSLAIILISGYGLLHANSVEASGNASVLKSIYASENTHVNLLQNIHFFDQAVYSEKTEKSHKIHVVESEVEEELTPHKKSVAYQSLLGTTVLSFAFAAFLPFQKEHNFQVSQYLQIAAYRLYVIFRVFRI